MTTAAANDLLFEPVTPTGAIKRDRWGRYVIPHPDTGKEQSWVRATTLAGTLADRFGLEQWDQRNVVLGIGARVDLYAQAASCTPADVQTLNQIIKEAKEASAAKAGANTGSALHRFTERLDRGEQVDVPAPWDADVAAYQQTMASHGVAVLPEWIERIVVVPDLGVAGTTDRLCNAMGWIGPRIGDLKTAKDVLKYSMVEIALQLAIYANATHWFDPNTGEVHKITETIDRHRALVMHLPIGKATCTLYEVDIAAGWDAVRLAVDVRDWRKRKDLASQLVPSAPQLEASLATIETKVPEPPAPPPERWERLPGNRLDLSEFAIPTSAEDSSPEHVSTCPIYMFGASANDYECNCGRPNVEVTDEELFAQRLDWLRNRVQAIKDANHPPGRWPKDEAGDCPCCGVRPGDKHRSPEPAAALAREWSTFDHIPTFKNGGPRDVEEIATVAEACWRVEGTFGLSFPDEEPGVEVVTQALQREGMVSGG